MQWSDSLQWQQFKPAVWCYELLLMAACAFNIAGPLLVMLLAWPISECAFDFVRARSR